MPRAGLTAWQGLFDHGRLAKGQTVVIHGAAGAVGSTAVQLARWAGARVRTFDGSLYAIGNQDPFTGVFVLSRGIVGTRSDIPTVASPLHKQVFDLRPGTCLDGGTARVPVFGVRRRAGQVEVRVTAP